MGILCAKKGCERKKAYGLFCVEHRVVKPLESAGPQCIAVGCRVARPLGSLFCDEHKLAMNRDCIAPTFKAFDAPVEPFRAPLPDLKCNFVIDPKRSACPNKLVVKWDGCQYVCSKTGISTFGFGDSPGAAIRNWQWWWAVPF